MLKSRFEYKIQIKKYSINILHFHNRKWKINDSWKGKGKWEENKRNKLSIKYYPYFILCINYLSICLQLHIRFIYMINTHSAYILNKFYLMFFYNAIFCSCKEQLLRWKKLLKYFKQFKNIFIKSCLFKI